MLKKMLNKKIKELKFDKLVLEQAKGSKSNLGTAWLSSNDYQTVKQLIMLHYTVYATYKLRTFVMGYPYEQMEDIQDLAQDIQDKEHSKLQRMMVKMSLQDLKLKKNKENPEESNHKKEESKGEEVPHTVIED